MADLTVSSAVDTFMGSADQSAMRTNLGLGALATVTPGTGVATALAIAVGSAGAFVVNGGALGTPASGALTNCTGLPVGSGVSGLGTNVATALGVAVGSAGAFITFNGNAGTPSALVGTNITGTAAGLTAGTASAVAVGGITGLGTGVATALAVNVGSSGAFVVLNGALGTPASGTLTNATGYVLNNIAAATGAATIANGNNTGIVWNWANTADSTIAHTFGETTAATNGTSTSGVPNQVLLRLGTLAASTMSPLSVYSRATHVFSVSPSTVQIYAADGSAAAPIYGYAASTNTGLARNINADGEIDFVVAGGVRASAHQTGLRVVSGTSTAQGLRDITNANTGLFWPATNTIGIGNATDGEWVRWSSFTQQVNQAGANTTAYAINARKARGTVASPTVITTGDDLLTVSGFGYVGATGTYVEAARMLFDSAGTIADNSTGCGGLISFQTRIVGGSLTTRLSIDAAGDVAVAGALGVTGVLTAATGAILNTPASVNLSNATALPISALTAGILAGNMTLGESTGQIVLDPTLSADGTWSGIMQAGTAGATLAFGDLVCLQASDSRWELTDADAESTSGPLLIGMCVLAAAADGDPTNILLYGKIRADAAFPTLTIGAPAYVGTTAGDIQVAQPAGTDDVIRVVGHAITADVLMFNPDPTWIVHT